MTNPTLHQLNQMLRVCGLDTRIFEKISHVILKGTIIKNHWTPTTETDILPEQVRSIIPTKTP